MNERARDGSEPERDMRDDVLLRALQLALGVLGSEQQHAAVGDGEDLQRLERGQLFERGDAREDGGSRDATKQACVVRRALLLEHVVQNVGCYGGRHSLAMAQLITQRSLTGGMKYLEKNYLEKKCV